MIRERDQEITDLRKEVENLEQSERNKAKNQSYIHAKALKDIEQKNENERKHDTKDGRKK